MKIVYSLLACLLLISQAWAQDNKTKGISLPASIAVTASDYSKKIVPTFDDPSKVIEVKWIVISNGATPPEYSAKGSGAGSYLTVTVPPPKEAVLIYAIALYAGDKPWMTDPVSTVLEGPGSTTPPPVTQPPVTQPPVTQPPVVVPPPVVQPPVVNPPTTTDVDAVFSARKGIVAIMVIDVNTANREIADLTKAETEFKKHFEQPGTGNHWYQFDIRKPELAKQGITKKLTDAQGKLIVPLPAVVLIDSTVTPAKMIGSPVPFVASGDTARNVANLLTAVAQALK